MLAKLIVSLCIVEALICATNQLAVKNQEYMGPDQAKDPQANTHEYDHSYKTYLYCYSCNENLDACRAPFNYNILKDYLVPCNGQCVKYQNPYDYNKWYRGCSWDFGIMERQTEPISFNGIVFYFCDTRGCNAY